MNEQEIRKAFEVLKESSVLEDHRAAWDVLKEHFNEDQLVVIEDGFEKGLSFEQVQVYAKPELNWEQMMELEIGLENGLSIEATEVIGQPEVSADVMRKMRETAQEKADIFPKDFLRDDPNARKCDEILKSDGMVQEAKMDKQYRAEMDKNQIYIEQLEKAVHSLENEVRDLKDHTVKAQATKAVDNVKTQAFTLKERFHQMINSLHDWYRLQVDVHKEQGKEAFYKRSQEHARGQKEYHQAMAASYADAKSHTKGQVQKFQDIQKEINTVKNSFKNIGRMLLGKGTKTVEEDKSTSIILDKMISHLEKQADRYEKLEKSNLNMADKQEKLEISYGGKVKECKRSVAKMVEQAAKEKQAQRDLRALNGLDQKTKGKDKKEAER